MKVLKKWRDKVTAICDSCLHSFDHSEFDRLEPAVVAGLEVLRCVDPVACRRRAELRGAWCQ